MATSGERIKERRKALGLSADELGERMGKDRATIFRYEKGDIDMVVAFLTIYGGTAEDAKNYMTTLQEDTYGNYGGSVYGRGFAKCGGLSAAVNEVLKEENIAATGEK